MAAEQLAEENALGNGDFHEWKDYKGGVTTESVGTPPNSLPTHWYGGPGVGAIATYDRIETSLKDKERSGSDRKQWALQVAWTKPQSDQWPGETHHSPAFRFTFLESFEIADVRKFAGKNVRLGFWGRGSTGKVEIVPIRGIATTRTQPASRGSKGKDMSCSNPPAKRAKLRLPRVRPIPQPKVNWGQSSGNIS